MLIIIAEFFFEHLLCAKHFTDICSALVKVCIQNSLEGFALDSNNGCLQVAELGDNFLV